MQHLQDSSHCNDLQLHCPHWQIILQCRLHPWNQNHPDCMTDARNHALPPGAFPFLFLSWNVADPDIYCRSCFVAQTCNLFVLFIFNIGHKNNLMLTSQSHLRSWNSKHFSNLILQNKSWNWLTAHFLSPVAARWMTKTQSYRNSVSSTGKQTMWNRMHL